MKQATISRGGQVSIPAEIRRRWQTSRVALEDHGDVLVVRPIPADPIGAALGVFAGPGPSTGESRRRLRAEEGLARAARDSARRRSAS